MKKVAIIGAGPIGLEAALAAHQRGYEVEVFERGTIAASVRAWGHVRMFSPFAMNTSAAGKALLLEHGVSLPAPEALLTGAEFAECYLEPLAENLGVPIYLKTEVCAIARGSALKTEMIGDPERSSTPFRLLVRQGDNERYASADLVFDCSGTFLTPNPLGDSGLLALGEGRAADAISYGVARADVLAGARVLVVGSGHSAATAVRDLAAQPGTSVAWSRRKISDLPCARIPGDPLPARDTLAAEVNALFKSGRMPNYGGTVAEAVSKGKGSLEVNLRGQHGERQLYVDHIVCATGFRPDLRLARELHVQTCWATEGTYPLAASLLGETGGDCLAVPAFGAETLRHPEPGYFALGMKSYGRTPDFLLRTGLEQISSLLEMLRM